MNDLIRRKDAIDSPVKMVSEGLEWIPVYHIKELPSAEPKTPSNGSITSVKPEKMHDRTMGDLISRQEAKDAIDMALDHIDHVPPWVYDKLLNALNEVPSAEQEKEIPRRVIWSGWKGTRYTRYKCPNCNKPVKNDDIYCHRCGQKLMFPHISHTPYIEGQKQELIVRWDDEE